MRVAMIARTIGPAQDLSMVSVELLRRSHEVVADLSFSGQPFVSSEALLEGAQVLVSAISSANITDEIKRVRLAIDRQIPVVLVSDTYGVYGRPDFPPDLRSKCAICVADVLEEELALKASFARSVYTGVPKWQLFTTPYQSAKQVNMRGVLGLGAKDKVLLAVFGKSEPMNRALLRTIGAAIPEIDTDVGRSLVLVVRFHPGDQALKSDSRAYDAELSSISCRVSSAQEVKRTEDLLMVTNVLLSFSGNTAGIEAVFRGIPVISVEIPEVVGNFKKQCGDQLWPPVASGAQLVARDVGQLTSLLDRQFGAGPVTTVPVERQLGQAHSAVEKIAAVIEDSVKQ